VLDFDSFEIPYLDIYVFVGKVVDESSGYNFAYHPKSDGEKRELIIF
jgi:hypothetical protein